MDNPIMAFPPMPPRKPLNRLAPPMASTVRLPSPGSLVKLSTTSAVIRDSMEPTRHKKMPWMTILEMPLAVRMLERS